MSPSIAHQCMRKSPTAGLAYTLISRTEKGMVAFKGLQKQAREYAVEYAKELSFGEWAIFNEILVNLEAFVDRKIRNGD